MTHLPNKLLILEEDHYIYFGGEEKVAEILLIPPCRQYELVERCGIGPVDARDKTGKSILGGKFPLDKLRGQKKFCVAMIGECGIINYAHIPNAH